MAEPIKINTSKYRKQGKVNIDGHIWDVHLPGAGSELRLSQAFRSSQLWASRLELVDRKIKDGTATEEDLDKYEEYDTRFTKSEEKVLDLFTQFFQDGTPNNSEVKAWLEETPIAFIQAAFEDIKEQAQTEQTEVADGQEKSPASS